MKLTDAICSTVLPFLFIVVGLGMFFAGNIVGAPVFAAGIVYWVWDIRRSASRKTTIRTAKKG